MCYYHSPQICHGTGSWDKTSEPSVDDCKQVETTIEQKYELEQLLSAEQAQVGAFRDNYPDEIVANAESSTATILPTEAEGGMFCQERLAILSNEDILKRTCHLILEKKRRIAMRSMFAHLNELISEGEPRKRSKAGILSMASECIADLDEQIERLKVQ